ncbi:MAG TPA: hypothetical protein VF508_11285 [Pyrinomonadaceae bacterium]|jgi:quercetin dioxygenase-like cupin family protein
MNGSRIDFDSLGWERAAEGLRCKSFERGGRRVRLLEFAPGYAEAEPCAKSHAGYVVAGELVLEFVGRAERLAAGDALVIEGEPHRVKAGAAGALVFLVEDA